MSASPLTGKRIVLGVTGGIAAYKCLDLIRRLRERGADVRCVMSEAAQQFVTPVSVGALTGQTVFTDIWDREASAQRHTNSVTRTDMSVGSRRINTPCSAGGKYSGFRLNVDRLAGFNIQRNHTHNSVVGQ